MVKSGWNLDKKNSISLVPLFLNSVFIAETDSAPSETSKVPKTLKFHLDNLDLQNSWPDLPKFA